MSACPHTKAHIVCASIFALEDTQRFMADIKIYCDDCGMPFRFIGFRCGASTTQPAVSVAGEELRVPIEPLDMDGPLPDYRKELMLDRNNPGSFKKP